MNIKEKQYKENKKKVKKIRKKVGEKTFRLIDDPLKVTIEKLDPDDSFWN